MRPLVAAAALLAVCAAPAFGGALGGDRHLAGSPTLSKGARQLIHQRMASHSKDMTELVWAVVLLDYPEADRLATAIASQPALARPLARDATELNAGLPERFFQLQDQLKARSTQLATAAHGRRPADTAKAYGKLAETCVSCHSVFLNEAEPGM